MSLMRSDWQYLSREGPSTYDNDGATPTFTVPDREVWHVLSIWLEYTASDTVATRQVRLVVQDADNDIMLEVAPAVTVTASQQRDFAFYPGAPDLTAARDTDLITTPIPAGLILRPGWDLIAIEESSGDTTDSDIMLVQMMYAKVPIGSTSGGTPQSTDN